MQKAIFSVLASLCLFSSICASIEGERFLQSEVAVKTAAYGHIDARGLKNLIESNTSFVLLDARGKDWHDGTVIHGAKLAFYTDTAEELESIIPDKNDLIVVYCYSFTCPLSDRLAQKLLNLGYQHVIEYPAGLTEWRDIANYQIEEIK